MAPSAFKVAIFITVAAFIFFSLLLPKSGIDGISLRVLSSADQTSRKEDELESSSSSSSKMVIGSKPPVCVNKCMKCRPCMATVVVNDHQKSLSLSRDQDDDTYYLLSWKCRCGNNLFQP